MFTITMEGGTKTHAEVAHDRRNLRELVEYMLPQGVALSSVYTNPNPVASDPLGTVRLDVTEDVVIQGRELHQGDRLTGYLFSDDYQADVLNTYFYNQRLTAYDMGDDLDNPDMDHLHHVVNLDVRGYVADAYYIDVTEHVSTRSPEYALTV